MGKGLLLLSRWANVSEIKDQLNLNAVVSNSLLTLESTENHNQGSYDPMYVWKCCAYNKGRYYSYVTICTSAPTILCASWYSLSILTSSQQGLIMASCFARQLCICSRIKMVCLVIKAVRALSWACPKADKSCRLGTTSFPLCQTPPIFIKPPLNLHLLREIAFAGTQK